MTSKFALAALTVGLSLVLAVPIRRALAEERTARSGIDRANFNTAVRPQDDFFRYVNGGWITRTPIPADRSAYGSFFALRDKSEANLRTIIEEAAANAALRSDPTPARSASFTRLL